MPAYDVLLEAMGTTSAPGAHGMANAPHLVASESDPIVNFEKAGCEPRPFDRPHNEPTNHPLQNQNMCIAGGVYTKNV
jgi:hypothetical protein